VTETCECAFLPFDGCGFALNGAIQEPQRHVQQVVSVLRAERPSWIASLQQAPLRSGQARQAQA